MSKLVRHTTNAANASGHPYHGSTGCRSSFESLAKEINALLEKGDYPAALKRIDECAERREEARANHNAGHRAAIQVVRNLYAMIEDAIAKQKDYKTFSLLFKARPHFSFDLTITRHDGKIEKYTATPENYFSVAGSRKTRSSKRRSTKKTRRTRKA
jgi:hypothetical protein